jgi:hypothetical protein
MLLPSLGSFCCCLFLPYEIATDSTEPTPVSLLFSCTSCNLLLPIKQYGEVHVEIRGSSQGCTWKFTFAYVEVHKTRTWKCTGMYMNSSAHDG